MFCQRCGTALGEALAACARCNAPIPQQAEGAALAQRARAATSDALSALRRIARDPVGGLPLAYEGLGEARALRAGIAFGVASMACSLLGGYLLLPDFVREDLFEFLGFGGVMKGLAFGALPFLCTCAGNLAVRRILGGRGGFGADALVAGAALLPAACVLLLAGFLGLGSLDAVGALSVFALSTGILMLFSGYTRIARLGERAATIAVPIVVLVAAWLAKVCASSMLGGPADAGDPFAFPY